MRTVLFSVLVALSFVVLADEKKPPKKAPPPKDEVGLARPDYLSDLARQILRRRMDRHGRDLHQLTTSVVLLRRDVARVLAEGIATEPRIVRPLPDSRDELNTALPERFFVLQDELRDRAKSLAEAAKKGTDRDLGEAFSRMMQTCVACHSAFLNPKAEETEAPPPTKN
ncbi:MAG: cytochrome c [Myxococcaceae bacterium]|nr:cytochrome c [Myxococcaceae bacterium]